MVETRRLTELVGRFADVLELPDGDLAVALSGGADSAALSYVLTTLGRDFRAAHVNHALADSPRLEEAAREVARRIGVELDVLQVDVPPGASPEGQARSARYRVLLEWVGPGESLLTAHTLDDQAETVLMNLLRGSGPTGLAGIPPRRGPVVRPMLGVSRSETRELAGLAGLPFFDDPTNLDPGIRRNVIRLEVLPSLSSRFNPRLVEGLARSAAVLRSDERHLRARADSVPVLAGDSSVAVAVGDLHALPRPVADRVLRKCLTRIRPPHGGSAAEVGEVWDVVDGSSKAVVLVGGLQVTVEGPLLVFRPESHAEIEPARVDLDVGLNSVSGLEITVERVEGVCRVAPIGSWAAIFEPDARLSAVVDGSGGLVVEANSEPAWLPGEKRLGVAWYRPGTSGYLSVFAREESGWTSSL